MTILQKNIIKSVSISLPLIGLALWAKAYFLVPIIVSVIFVILHRHEINTLNRAIDRLPNKLKDIVKISISIALGIGLAAYIIAFITDVDIYTSISSNKSRICFIDKLKYGAVVDKDRRTFSLGEISRGNAAIVALNDSVKTAIRIAAVPGDEISIVNGCALVNGSSEYESDKATAPFYVIRTTPLNIVHQLQRHTEELVDSSFRTTSNIDSRCSLPVKEVYNKWQKYTYSVLYRNKSDERIFPHSLTPNNALQMYPVSLPQRNQTVSFNSDNRDYLSDIINKYEDCTAEVKNGIVYINNQPATDYTFKYGYYFLLNDNREILADSRIWGPVPEYCIIGSTSNLVL